MTKARRFLEWWLDGSFSEPLTRLVAFSLVATILLANTGHVGASVVTLTVELVTIGVRESHRRSDGKGVGK